MTEGFARDQTGFTRKQMTELVGEKVVLFPLREEDAPLIIRWRNTKRPFYLPEALYPAIAGSLVQR